MYCFVRIEWLTWLGYSRDDGLIYPDTCAFLLLCVRYWHPRLALFFLGGWRQLTCEDVLWPCWIRGVRIVNDEGQDPQRTVSFLTSHDMDLPGCFFTIVYKCYKYALSCKIQTFHWHSTSQTKSKTCCFFRHRNSPLWAGLYPNLAMDIISTIKIIKSKCYPTVILQNPQNQ